MKLLCVFTLSMLAFIVYTEGINMAAFNIEVLGVTKMGKPEVVAYLVKIISRYDLVVIQEYRDISGVAIVDLLNAVNAYSTDTYNMTIGSRVGRTSSKEQYVFMYKPSALTVQRTYEYPDTNDDFEREPMIVHFRTASDCVEQTDFVIIAIHIKPTDAVAEINHLAGVYDHAVDEWGIQDVALVGDFNADCSYVGASHWSSIALRTQSRFHWLIPDETDTTLYSSSCAYDRLVVTGNLVNTARIPSVFYYDSFYGLSPELAGDISDHYPVEMTIL